MGLFHEVAYNPYVGLASCVDLEQVCTKRHVPT